MWVISHDDYRISNNIFNKFDIYDKYIYAYGIMFDILQSNLVVLDIDNKPITYMMKLVEKLLQQEQIDGLDLIQSSQDCWHISMSLLKDYNLMTFYIQLQESNIGCGGFIKYALLRRFVIVRVSQKFIGTHSDDTTIPTIKKCFRKIDNVWIQVVPLLDKEPEKPKKQARFSLRG